MGAPSITDIQYDALDAGVARGASLLISAPTSTGKTLIGYWAAQQRLRADHGRVVYLVSLRALAAQKFSEIVSIFSLAPFNIDKSEIVLATGDGVRTADPDVGGTDPLSATVLVATYEKYLGLLAGLGVTDLNGTLVICDEIQILGEVGRGRQIEILLTLLRRMKPTQIVGLSAVLEVDDAKALADWLGAQLIKTSQREKHLSLECRASNQKIIVETDRPEVPQIIDGGHQLDVLAIVRELLREKANTPIVVFCMTRKRIDDLVKIFANERGVDLNDGISLPLLLGLLDPTQAANYLTRLLAVKVAFHSADLTEEEREVVEEKLLDNKIDVVFATTTLAAGVNFPFGAVVFDRWERWDGRVGRADPIAVAEFHNAAGRAGRMGFEENPEKAKVIWVSNKPDSITNAAKRYLEPDRLSPLPGRLEPASYDQLVLQLVSTGLCRTADEIRAFVADTWSAARAHDRDRFALQLRGEAVGSAIEHLRQMGLLM